MHAFPQPDHQLDYPAAFAAFQPSVRDTRHRRCLCPHKCKIPLRELLPVLGYPRESSALFAEFETEPPMAQRRSNGPGETWNHVEDHPFRIVGQTESAHHEPRRFKIGGS